MKALFRRALAALGRALDDKHNRHWQDTVEYFDSLHERDPRLAPGTSPPSPSRSPSTSSGGSSAVKPQDLEESLAAALRADRSIDELEGCQPGDRAPRDIIAHHEARAARLFEADRVARDWLISELEPLLRRHPGQGVIVVAGDGSACALATDSDGLVVVPADRVIRLDRLASAEARAMVSDLAEQLRVHRQ